MTKNTTYVQRSNYLSITLRFILGYRVNDVELFLPGENGFG